MANNNQIYKMSNAGGFKSLTRYYDMLAGNSVWNPWSPVGAYDALATVTVPSGGAASITFSGIPQTYKHLQIRGISYNTAGQNNFGINFNGDTGANYTYHALRGDGSSAIGAAGTGVTYGYLQYDNNTGGTFASRIIDILDYTNTNKLKTIRALGGWDANGSGIVFLQSSLWTKAGTGVISDAVNTITLSYNAGNFAQYSQLALYGVK